MSAAPAKSSWLQVRVSVPEAQVAEAEQALLEAGAHAVSLLDAADVPVHEPEPGSTPIWPETIVEGLFEADTERALLVRALGDAGLETAAAAARFADLADRDWERAWMDQYEPMRFGESLWICPSHLEPAPDWPLVIRLDPGLAFGSGTHPTTALCLEWIDSMVLDGLEVLDFGCGSGVLAIACALKGAARLVAVDHDPQALTAAADNAERNGLAGRIRALLPGDFGQLPAGEQRFDLVLANILAAPLIELAPRLNSCLRPGATLVLSGILPEQAESVIAAYADLGHPVDHSECDQWIRLVFRAGRGQ